MGQADLFNTPYLPEDIEIPEEIIFRKPEEITILKQPQKEESNNIFSNKQIIDEAFKHFRKKGFPYRRIELHEMMQEINTLANTKTESLLKTNVGSLTADSFQPHRFEAQAFGMNTPIQSFNDDQLLKKSLGLQLQFDKIETKYFPTLVWVSGTQSASNFRPGFALYYYRKYCKEGYNILDTSMGYGGRMVGYFASKINGSYTGIDPNVPTIEGNRKLAEVLGFQNQINLINLPVEDVDKEQYKNKFDFQFTSPPYYLKELYSTDPTQSWKRYNLGIFHWVNGFLKKMFEFQFSSLKPGSYSIINIADVEIKGKIYPLPKYSIEKAIEVGFNHIGIDDFTLPPQAGKGSKRTTRKEPVLIFQKPEV